MNGYQIRKMLSNMTDKQLKTKYQNMNKNNDANIEINLEVYFRLIDEMQARRLL